MASSKNFVFLKNIKNGAIRIHSTKFPREIGDRLQIEEKIYEVQCFGTESECVVAYNKGVSEINAQTRLKNQEIRRQNSINKDNFFSSLSPEVKELIETIRTGI